MKLKFLLIQNDSHTFGLLCTMQHNNRPYLFCCAYIQYTHFSFLMVLIYGKLSRREEKEIGGGTTHLRTADQGQDPVAKDKTMPGKGSVWRTV